MNIFKLQLDVRKPEQSYVAALEKHLNKPSKLHIAILEFHYAIPELSTTTFVPCSPVG